jgi:hypothetical protein
MLDDMRGVDLLKCTVLETVKIGSISHVIDAGPRIGVEDLPARRSNLPADVKPARHIHDLVYQKLDWPLHVAGGCEHRSGLDSHVLPQRRLATEEPLPCPATLSQIRMFICTNARLVQ